MRAILPEPDQCDNCASFNIAFEEYRNAVSDWRWIWICSDCRSFVGTHPNTRNPMGRMADAHTRKLRAKAHEAFDPIWRVSRLLTREQAYDWIARQLGIPSQECHFSWMNADQLQKAIFHSCTYIVENLHKADKRQKARHEQKRRAIQSERNAINRRRDGKR